MDDIDWKRVELFFPKAMRSVGYFSYQPQSIFRIAHGKRCEWQDGDLRLIDEWSETPDCRRSAGVTTIEHLNNRQNDHRWWMPIWRMCYGGWYSKDVTSLLKSMICLSYDTWEKRPFQGCRGPEEEWFNDYYVYQNMLSPNLENSFKQFESHERILHYPNGYKRGKSVVAGYHSIFGMALVSRNEQTLRPPLAGGRTFALLTSAHAGV